MARFQKGHPGRPKGSFSRLDFQFKDRIEGMGLDAAAEIFKIYHENDSPLVKLKALEIIISYCFKKPGSINYITDAEFMEMLREKLDEERVIEGGEEALPPGRIVQPK